MNDSEQARGRATATSSPATPAHPGDLKELADTVRDGGRLRPSGSGTAASWGAAVRDIDTVVHTDRLDQVVAYNPADMTVAVGAGIRLATLQRMVADHGQRVSLDADRVRRGATVGGLLATGDAGPLRHAYGSLGSLVLGATVVFADGTVARTGGHVVKNVAGYDLAKLVSGSLGTLAVIGEVVLRLHPRPEHIGTLAVHCPVTEGFRHANTLVRSPFEPAALQWEDGRFTARFEGTESSVASRLEKAAALLPVPAELQQEPLPWPAEPSDHDGRADDPTATRTDPAHTVVQVSARPSDVGDLAADLDVHTEHRDLTTHWRSQLTAGVHTIRLAGGDVEEHAAVLHAWRSRVEAAGGSVTLHDRIDGLDERIDAWGTAPSAASVWRALKDRLDPDHRLSPGRLAPWIDE